MARIAQLLCAAALALGVSATDQAGFSKEDVGRLHDESLMWGPYKPNLYFGVRPRVAKGPWSSLMWAGVNSFEQTPQAFRYTCEQGEDIHGYGWDEYDIRTGGVQSIHDDGNKIDVTTSFVKVPGGEHGGSWAVRIKGELQDDAPADTKTMLFYYINEEDGKLAAVNEDGTEAGFDSDVTFQGTSKALGDYTILVTKGIGKHPTSDNKLLKHRDGSKTLVNSLDAPDDVAWQAKQLVFARLKDGIDPYGDKIDPENPPPVWQVYRMLNNPGEGNVQVVQKTFQGSFEFDVIFSSGSAGHELTSEDVTRRIKENSKAFNKRFSEIFKLQKPFTGDKYRTFAKSMFSNLLGGVGYFQGEQVIDRSYADEYDEVDERFWEDAAEARARKNHKLEGPYELFTSVPSRPFFPRGFLWDEGFHLLPIADWDTDVTLDIVKSWFNTMDEEGWIPREQILGPEARSKVPEEFQVQYPHYANPPTLFLVIEGFLERLRQSKAGSNSNESQDLRTAHLDQPDLGDEYLRQIYPLLRRQYDWFRKTQRGDIKGYDREAFSTKEAYRWRGRTETHVLTSGLDDYPRPQPPSPGELHVDLMSWVGLMTKSLLTIATALGNEEDVKILTRNLEAIEHNLNDLHWSEKEGTFCDASVDEFEEHSLVCHKGYISLTPFLVGLLKPEDPKLGKILELIGDEKHLWSQYGIRSLSTQDPYYNTGENYWRSPIWMPINYLIVSQLRNLALQDGPHKARARELYSQLRNNLINTVYNSWKETGFAWEQYNPDTGAGQRTQHFTGWTSLVVKLMAMEDLTDDDSGKDEL